MVLLVYFRFLIRLSGPVRNRMTITVVFRHVLLGAKNGNYLRNVLPPIRMYQRGFHRTDFSDTGLFLLIVEF
jgi:hypothetical protein